MKMVVKPIYHSICYLDKNYVLFELPYLLSSFTEKGRLVLNHKYQKSKNPPFPALATVSLRWIYLGKKQARKTRLCRALRKAYNDGLLKIHIPSIGNEYDL